MGRLIRVVLGSGFMGLVLCSRARRSQLSDTAGRGGGEEQGNNLTDQQE